MSQVRAADEFQEALLEDDPVQLYERAPCGYLSTTPDGQIIKVNATFATWTGFAVSELVGRQLVDLLSVGGRIYYETHYAPMLRMQGSVREIAVDVVRAGGDRLPVLLNARLDRGPDDQPRVVRIAVFDATERRAYELELLRAKEAAEDSERRASSLARTLQETLIPPLPPTIPGLDVAAAYRPAGDGTEVGGDFYDVFPVGSDDWVLVLGDVSGKGAAAAVVTALVRYSVRALAFSLTGPGSVLQQLDQAVLRHETDRFCTIVIVRLSRTEDGWTAVISTGGHPPPLLIRRDGAPVQVPVAGSLIGILNDAHFNEQELRLHPGDTLLLYTDGVTEARNDLASFFGTDRLLETVGRLGGAAAAVVAGLVDVVMAFQAGTPRDDIAVLAVTVPDA